jgi:hypothetical protein
LGKAYCKGGSTAVSYWLRSPISSGQNQALYVHGSDGAVWLLDVDWVTGLGVHPIFKLNPSSVIFASEIVEDNATLWQTAEDENYAVGSGGKKNYKLTIVNPDDLSIETVTVEEKTVGNDTAVKVAPEDSVIVKASNASDNTTLTYKILKVG